MAQEYDGEELVVYWTLLPAEAALVGGKRGPHAWDLRCCSSSFSVRDAFLSGPRTSHPPRWPTSRRRWRHRSRNGAPMIGTAARSNITGQKFARSGLSRSHARR